ARRLPLGGTLPGGRKSAARRSRASIGRGPGGCGARLLPRPARADAREARESATRGAARAARGDGGPGGIGSAQRGEAARALDGPPGGYGGARRGRSVPRRGRISGGGSDAWRRSSGGRPVHPRRPCCQDRAKTLVIGVAVAPLRGKITHDGLVRSTDGSSRRHVRRGAAVGPRSWFSSARRALGPRPALDPEALLRRVAGRVARDLAVPVHQDEGGRAAHAVGLEGAAQLVDRDGGGEGAGELLEERAELLGG